MSDEQPMQDDGRQAPGAPEQPAPADSDRIARLRARSASSEAVPPRFASPPPEAVAAPAEPAPTAPAEPVSTASSEAVPAAPAEPVSAAPAPAERTTPYDAPGHVLQAPVDGSGRTAGMPRTVVTVATAVLAATATALAALVTSHLSSANSVESTRSEVVGAATSGVATVLSYDYRHLDADFSTAERLLTPRFRKQYVDTTAKGVQPLAAKYKAISSADVSAAGVVEASGDRAVVLVFVNQTVTNSQLTAPRLDRSRIDVTLVRSDGHWLIDKLTTL